MVENLWYLGERASGQRRRKVNRGRGTERKQGRRRVVVVLNYRWDVEERSQG